MFPSNSPWLLFFRRNPSAKIRLFCFHYAGGSASAYRTWVGQLPDYIEIIGVQLPGREGRFQDPFVTSFDQLMTELSRALEPYLDKPFVVFGHSLGSLISFEWLRVLAASGRPGPLTFFASGRQAPHFPNTDPHISALPEDEFVTELLKEYEDNLGDVLANKELRNAFIPQLRADFGLSEDYEYKPGIKLMCPIVSFAGEDEPKIGEPELTGWKEHTTSGFSSRRFPGGHFYVHDQEELLLQELNHRFSLISSMPLSAV